MIISYDITTQIHFVFSYDIYHASSISLYYLFLFFFLFNPLTLFLIQVFEYCAGNMQEMLDAAPLKCFQIPQVECRWYEVMSGERDYDTNYS